MKRFRVITPRLGWSRIMWSPEDQLSSELVTTMAAVAEIPGITQYVSYMDIPYTADFLAPVIDFLEVLDCEFALPLTADQIDICPEWGSYDLYPYQCVGAGDTLLNRPVGTILADEMGLGKTATAIAAAETHLEARGTRQKVLVIGPPFSREVGRNELLSMGVITKPDDLCVIRTRDIDHSSYNPQARWTFVHYEIAWAWRSGLLYDTRNNHSVCIIDEAHWIKNGRTQRAKAAAILASVASLRIGLTGTPIENQIGDLWYPLNVIAGPKSFGGPLEFRQRYSSAIYTGYGWEDGEPSNVEELRLRLQTCYLRRTVDEVGKDIPPLTHSSRVVEINQTCRREHDEILRNTSLRVLVQAILEGQIQEVLPVLTRLRQATSAGKLSSTVELVNDFRDQGESVVVFCHERQTAKKIAERTDSWYVSGEKDIDTRNEIVQEFQNTGGGLITTYGALKEGVTLTQARIVMLHDLDWKFTTILQAVKRINRIGQKHACQAIWILAEGSADIILAEALQTKAKITEEILGIKDAAAASDDVNLKDFVSGQDFEKRMKKVLQDWEESYELGN